MKTIFYALNDVESNGVVTSQNKLNATFTKKVTLPAIQRRGRQRFLLSRDCGRIVRLLVVCWCAGGVVEFGSCAVVVVFGIIIIITVLVVAGVSSISVCDFNALLQHCCMIRFYNKILYYRGEVQV